LGPCHINSIANPQSYGFLSEVWVNGKGSLPQGQHSANQMLNKQELWEGGGGRIGGKALSICYTEKISKFGRRHTIAQRLGDEGLVKLNCSIIFVKR
jgi:hypothetical protein